MNRYTLAWLEDELRQTLKEAGGLSEQVRRTLALAYRAHNGQLREQRESTASPVPYIVHPVGVAKIAISLLPYASLPDTLNDVISACIAHDVLEDTAVSLNELEAASSVRAASIVLSLTKPTISGNSSRTERNAAFIAQIRNAGATASFVKICDAMHNIGRPASMPPKLLTKTIRKATFDYLQLADNPAFSGQIRLAYEARIRDAEAVVRQDEEFAPASSATFESALADSIEKSHGKVLEAHDIAEIIESRTGARRVFAGNISDFLAIYAKTLLEQLNKQQRHEITLALEAGKLDLTVDAYKNVELRALEFNRIFAFLLNETNPSKTTRRLFVVIDDRAPSWVSYDTLFALTSVLGQRLRDQAARRMANLAGELNRLSLPIDAALALDAELGHAELMNLRANLDAAEFVHHNLLEGVKALLAIRFSSHVVDRIESRVKTAQSIVQKMLIRKLTSVDQLDDFVGIRIVVLSRAAQTSLVEAIQQTLAAQTSELRKALPLSNQPVSIDRINSSDGYKAVHLRFAALATSRGASDIACEIQVRTVHEDAWARISQLIAYKSGRKSAVIQKLLNELTALRDTGDDRLSEIGQG